MEDKQNVEQKAELWRVAGFIKGVGVQLLLCATESLVCVLIGSPAVHYRLLCVFPVTSLVECRFCVCWTIIGGASTL